VSGNRIDQNSTANLIPAITPPIENLSLMSYADTVPCVVNKQMIVANPAANDKHARPCIASPS